MLFETWLTFALACSALLAIPGPTVTFVVSYVLGNGRKSAWATVPGVVLGDFTAMTASLLGAGIVLQTSTTLFTVLKMFGAAYLVWLGVKLWRSKPEFVENSKKPSKASGLSMFWNTFVITSLNPKGIVFFIAFLPQFVNPELAPLSQFVIMEVTFLTLAAINIILWILLAGRLREQFRRPSTLKLVNRIGGSFLIGAGLLTASSRQS